MSNKEIEIIAKAEPGENLEPFHIITKNDSAHAEHLVICGNGVSHYETSRCFLNGTLEYLKDYVIAFGETMCPDCLKLYKEW